MHLKLNLFSLAQIDFCILIYCNTAYLLVDPSRFWFFWGLSTKVHAEWFLFLITKILINDRQFTLFSLFSFINKRNLSSNYFISLRDMILYNAFVTRHVNHPLLVWFLYTPNEKFLLEIHVWYILTHYYMSRGNFDKIHRPSCCTPPPLVPPLPSFPSMWTALSAVRTRPQA